MMAIASLMNPVHGHDLQHGYRPVWSFVFCPSLAVIADQGHDVMSDVIINVVHG